MLTAGGTQAASGLQGHAACRVGQTGGSFAALSWVPAASRGSEQRVAYTLFRDGFERGDFRVLRALGSDASSFELEPLEGQAIHYWVVLTLQQDGWRPSTTASFEGPTCPVDQG